MPVALCSMTRYTFSRLTFAPAAPNIPPVTETIKRWALGFLAPTEAPTEGLELRLSKSGAVKFDVGAFQKTDAGVKQLKLVQKLADTLGLDPVGSRRAKR